MKPRVGRDRRAWTGLVVALIAVVALGVTVFMAERALSQASDVVVRGEADSLVSSLVADLAQEDAPPTAEVLDRELDVFGDRGLRYVLVMERDHVVAEAGTAELATTRLRPGETAVVGHRVRAAGVLPPIRPADPPSQFGKHARPIPAFVVIELEPPVIQNLRADLTRIGVGAAAAAIVLVVIAIALMRSARRLAAIEARAAREQRLVALGGMSSVMAHELRNPLASLKGHAQLLAEDLVEPALKKKAERVVAEAQRLEDLTTSLLDFVRDGPIERAEVSVDALVASSLADLPKERVDVRVVDVAAMVIDEARLSRAVHNLVDNALKATADDARVELAIERRAADVVVTVRDHGPGLPTDGSQIFEPFVTTRVRGTGLGLPVARRIAEQHGGTLDAADHPAGGAVFTLRFPLVTTHP